ncbi:ABC transporter substrate-binding protein [Embleya sp. NPDC056575]|uniref:ABC transporter substrate-binding protein n=1 Tax=unclassified Embleya TaxID=2699296 RepID=UPI0036AD965C
MTPASPISRRSFRVSAAGLLAGALAFTAACSGSAADDKKGGSSSGTLKIGLTIPLTGVYAALGPDLQNGFQTYLDQHGGKLGGHKVELVITDEGDGPQTSVPSVTKLIKQDKVTAVVGLSNAATVAANVDLVNDNKVPMIGAVGRPGEIKRQDYVWHTSYLSEEPGVAAAPYIKEAVQGPVYAIGPEYQGGFDQLRGFTETFDKLGGKLANPDGKTKWTPFPATTNFQPYFNEIKNSGAKAVYTFYAGTAAVNFVKQYKQSDIKDIPLYAAGFLTEGAVLGAEGDAAKGVLTSLNYTPTLDIPANRSFVAAYQAKYNALPTMMSATMYDAAAVLDKAIAAAGDKVTPEAVNAQIANTGKVDSPRGPWEFNAKSHAPVQKWYLREVKQDGTALSNVMVRELGTLG